MTQLQKAETSEADVIRQALSSVPRPAYVKKVDFELGFDSTNAESVTIWIRVPDDIDSTKSTVRKLNEFAEKLRDAIFATGTDRFPYVRYKLAAA
jgi:hypothetical protein